MKEKISIIVPVYNARATLNRCVDSLRGQTHENIEILLVNDGSKDDSLAICQSLAREDERIRVIDKPNGGVSSARNAGLEEATGEIVMFCDSDDWVEPDWCGCMYDHFVPGSLTVCEIQRSDVPREDHPNPMEIVDRKHYLHHRMLMCSPINKLFSRRVIRENNLRFPPDLSLGEDFVFCLQYLCAISGDVRFVYRELYHYDTSNENSLSKRAPALEQCEKFYRSVTDAMDILGALDEESIRTRDEFVAPHFERHFQSVAENRELSLREKMAEAARIGRLEAFRNTCRRGIRWGNPVYVWLMRHGQVKPAMAFLLLRSAAKKNA